jgi:Zn-dependent peptidase ImmA (M78 family)
MKVKFLPLDHIEAASYGVLDGYGRKFKPVTAPPVPAEEILESLLNLSLLFDDLPRVMEHPDVLGAIRFREGEVLVDQSLDPTENPQKEGRYRFTVAHEMGHWELHRHTFLQNANQPLLFDDGPGPTHACRSTSAEPVEWQANTFAGFLLMPKELIFQAWKDQQGSFEPYDAMEELKDLSARWCLADDNRPTVKAAKAMATRFKVSGQAMQIRLIGLGLVQTKIQPASLFSQGAGR